jgi:hypothetical protein
VEVLLWSQDKQLEQVGGGQADKALCEQVQARLKESRSGGAGERRAGEERVEGEEEQGRGRGGREDGQSSKESPLLN